jgi:hypothetical protein
MRFLIFLCLCVALTAGCKTKSAKTKSPATGNEPQTAARVNETVTPLPGKAGKVASVNASAKFAVIKFPITQLPAVDQRLNVYRAGVKVGEIKISPQRLDNLSVGDIVAGEVQVDDDVREQ